MIYCGFSQLKTAIDIIDASADFIAKTKRLILVPLFYFVVTMIIVGFWLFGIMSVYNMGQFTINEHTLDRSTKFVDPKKEKMAAYMGLFMFFGILWIVNFIKAKSSFITMVSASTYYFNSSPTKDGEAEVSLGFKFAYMYHLGSIAFGSFLIALIQFIRIVFMVIAEKAREASGDNPAVKIAIACADCLLRCLEKITDYINTMAYGFMAVSGDSFCSSAW